MSLILVLNVAKSREVILAVDKVITTASAGKTRGSVKVATDLPIRSPRTTALTRMKLRFLSTLTINM